MQTTLFESSKTSDECARYSGVLPPGLSIIPNFLSKAEERDLELAIDCSPSPWLSDLRRRVKHFGFRYDYKARALSSRDRLGNLPDWARDLAKRLVENGYFDSDPDQVIVNEYLPGQGIAPHIDRDTCFGPVIASVSLGSDIVMDFLDENSGSEGHLLLPARSALIFQDAARYRWKHGIASRKSDVVGEERLERTRRISLTFRSVRL
jgi:alkylated DNA repair dioxygenase AlkB